MGDNDKERVCLRSSEDEGRGVLIERGKGVEEEVVEGAEGDEGEEALMVEMFERELFRVDRNENLLDNDYLTVKS